MKSLCRVTEQDLERIRRYYPDTVLIFQDEDFYEAFGPDAKIIEETTTTMSGDDDRCIMGDVDVPAILDDLARRGYAVEVFSRQKVFTTLARKLNQERGAQ